jgi:hypothetical protein
MDYDHLGNPCRADRRIDFEFNYPMLPDQTALIAKSLDGVEKPAALDAALRRATSVGTPAVRSVAAAYLSQGAWSPAPEQLETNPRSAT